MFRLINRHLIRAQWLLNVAGLLHLLAGFLLLTGCNGERQLNQREQLDQAVAIIESGNVSQGIALLEPMHEESPKNPIILEQLAFAYTKNDDYVKAAVAFTKLSELSPDQSIFRLYAAKALQDAGDLEGATREYRNYLRKKPEEYSVWEIVAELHLRQNQKDEAIRALSRSYEIDPNGPLAVRIGRILEDMEYFSKAEKWYYAALKSEDEGTPVAVFGLLREALRKPDYPAALAFVQFIDREHPDAFEAADQVEYERLRQTVLEWYRERGGAMQLGQAVSAETARTGESSGSAQETPSYDNPPSEAADGSNVAAAGSGSESSNASSETTILAQDESSSIPDSSTQDNQRDNTPVNPSRSPSATAANSVTRAESTPSAVGTTDRRAGNGDERITTPGGGTIIIHRSGNNATEEPPAWLTSPDSGSAPSRTPGQPPRALNGTTATAGTPGTSARSAQEGEPDATTSREPTQPAAPKPNRESRATAAASASSQNTVPQQAENLYERIIATTSNPRDLIEKAIELREAGDFDNAIELFKEAVNRDQTLHRAWQEMSETYLLMGNPRWAEVTAQEAVNLEPGNAFYRLHFLKVAQKTYPPRRFMRELADAAQAFPDSPDILLGTARGFNYIEKNPGRALELYAHVLEIAPDHPQAEAIREEMAKLQSRRDRSTSP